MVLSGTLELLDSIALSGTGVLTVAGTGSVVAEVPALTLSRGGPAAVPEPGTAALLLAGTIFGLGVWLKKR